MLTIPNLSQSSIIEALKDSLQEIEDARTREVDYLLDWYEGTETDQYVSQFFGTETLKQAPLLRQNLTRRVAAIRSMTFKRAPKLSVDERYFEHIDKFSLIAQRRLVEKLTFMLGCMAFRSYWDETTQKVTYEAISHFTPLFLAGDSKDKPVGICYPIEYFGNARVERPLFAVWTEDRYGVPGQHYLLDEHGVKISVEGNPDDINPYGILPVVFSHRYPPIRDFYVGNASDVVACDLAVNVANFEMQICQKYSAMGIKYVTGIDSGSDIRLGPDKIIYLPSDATFGVTNSGGSLVEIIDATRFLVESTLNNNHIRAKYARDDSGNAPSAMALSIIELESLDEKVAVTEDIWRPWEHRRYAVDRRIIDVETGVDVGKDYKVDFLDPNYALTPESEIAYWSWMFDRKLAEPIDWYDFKNSDASEDDRQAFLSRQESLNVPEAPEENLLNRLKNANRSSSRQLFGDD